MRVFVFTFEGYGLPIAHRLQQEGHEVVVAQVEDQATVLSEIEQNAAPETADERERRLSLYDGLLEKQPAQKVLEGLNRRGPEPDTFLFFDLNHLYRVAEEAEAIGLPGNYPTCEDYRLEIDREAAKTFVQKNYPQLRVGENHRFSRASEAKAFLKDSDDLWVLKGLEEDARTVVPDTDELSLAHGQILNALEMDRETYESAGFILERKIGNSLEFTPQRIYFNGQLLSTLMVIENKELGAGNVGPQTDCAQDLAFLIDHDSKIAQMAFPPVVDEMARQHRGLFFWDASLYVDSRSKRAYFGEFCANRPGYNALYNQMSLASGAGRYLEEVVQGRNPFPENQVGLAVRLFNLHRDDSGEPLGGAAVEWIPQIEKDLWLVDLKKRRRKLVTAGYKDTLGVATGCGNSVSEAARNAHRAVDGLSFEGMYYRPQFDLVSREYRSSIVNRIEFGLQQSYYKVGFGLS